MVDEEVVVVGARPESRFQSSEVEEGFSRVRRAGCCSWGGAISGGETTTAEAVAAAAAAAALSEAMETGLLARAGFRGGIGIIRIGGCACTVCS